MMKKYIALPIAVLISGGTAFGATLNWSSPLTQGSWTGENVPAAAEFTIGYFAGDFVPTRDNVTEWVANWSNEGLVNPTTNWAPLGANPAFGQFGRDTVVRPDATGNQGYILGYDSLEVAATSNWILITNPGWIFPAGTPVGSIALPSDPWVTTQEGTVAIWGSLNHPSFPGSAGTASRELAFEAIPEPSTYALIFGLGILGFLGYRRFRK